jgi:outer membrane lipoprotein carrier protein
MTRHFIFIFLLMAVSSFAGEKENELLNKLQKKFETIIDLTVDVAQKSHGKEILSGKLSYKKENQFYLDLKSNLIVSDGSTIWNYNKESKKVIINDVDETDPSFFSFNRIINDYPTKCDLSSEQNGDFDVLIFVPKQNSNLGFDEAKVWIDKDNLISKVELRGSGSEKTELDFSNYKLNQNLAESKFKFNPPEGSSIIDLR